MNKIKKLPILLLSFIMLFSCTNNPTVLDEKVDINTLNYEQDLTEEKISDLFTAVFMEYKDAHQVALFSPDSVDNHILYIYTDEETLIKNVSKDFIIEKSNTSNLLLSSQMSNCDDLHVANIYGENSNLLQNLKQTICSNDESGLITFGYIHGSYAISRVEYFSHTNVVFPQIATFTHSWMNTGSQQTHWRSCRDNTCQNFFSQVADNVRINNNLVNILIIRDLFLNRTVATSTPVLTSPPHGDEIVPAWTPLQWNASVGNPTYEVNINCGSTYNNTVSTNNTVLYLPSAINTSGLTCTWRVRASNLGATSSWSSQRTLHTIPGALVTGTWTIPVSGHGSWTASAVQGPSPYTYEWERMFVCRVGYTCPPGSTSWHSISGASGTVHHTWSANYRQVRYRAKIRDGNNVWSRWSPTHEAYFNAP